MSRMIVAACIAVTLCLLCVTGCAKKTQPPAPAEPTKTAAEYKAEAEKEIKDRIGKAPAEHRHRSRPGAAVTAAASLASPCVRTQ